MRCLSTQMLIRLGSQSITRNRAREPPSIGGWSIVIKYGLYPYIVMVQSFANNATVNLIFQISTWS